MATELKNVYKCKICGNIVEVVHPAQGTLVCCGEEMKLLKENTTDAATEKHVPVITRSGSEITVTVGSVEHPMGDDHYIEFIELLTDGKLYTEFLKPGDPPVAKFFVEAEEVEARAYCNLHGLWKA